MSLAPATRSTAAQRWFRRFLTVHLLLTVLGIAAFLAHATLVRATPPDWHLAIVYLCYWLALIPLVRLALDARRLWRKAAFATLLTGGLLVAGLELLGRYPFGDRGPPSLSECAVAHRRLHHGLLPNTRMIWSPGETANITIQTNEDGLRTDYSRRQFLKAGFRVAVLGDSYVFGFLVNLNESVPMLLEGALRAERAALDVRVLNAGMISYSPLLERQLFADVVCNYRPHVTIMSLNVTDIGDDYKYGRENRSTGDDLHFPYPDEYLRPAERPWEGSPSLQLLRASRLAEPMERLLGRPPAAPAAPGRRYDYYRFELAIGGVVETNHFFPIRHPLDAVRPYYDQTLAHIRRVRDDCRAAGSEFLLVLMPYNLHFNNAESPKDIGRIGRHYNGEEPHRYTFFEYFEPAARQASIDVLNLLPAFQESEEFPLCFEHDSHYNAAGNRLAARTIARYLVQSGKLASIAQDNRAPTVPRH